MESNIQNTINEWLNGNYDEATKQEVRKLLNADNKLVVDAFYKNLEFGTGGLRGIMGAGTNRMNQYTVGMATQGFANYLKESFPNQEIKVVVAHDSRNKSDYFTQIIADIFSANGIFCYVFSELRPTPELSFAVRELKCKGGVMVTASHNPKEYNGYKAYWEDGGQLMPPNDTNVIKAVEAIQSIDDVKWKRNEKLVQVIDEEIDSVYIEKVKGLSMKLGADIDQEKKKLKIVYTPLHGTGLTMLPRAMKEYGFENFFIEPHQAVLDGNFPTVDSPNPENKEAFELALIEAKRVEADLIFATDPDADRLAVGIKDPKGGYMLLTGNQTAVLLTHYLLKERKNNNELKPNDFIIKTIVSTELLKAIADRYDVKCYDELTGFKYIADVIRRNEGKENYICGGEESYGFLIGDFVRDKDAISACCIFAEMTAWVRSQGKTIFEELVAIYQEYGYYKEDLVSVTKQGKEGLEEIKAMMAHYRSTPPTHINGSKVVMIKDYQKREILNCETKETQAIHLPISNVLQFFTEDHSKVTVRPSGTEPKIKYYYAVRQILNSINDFERVDNELAAKIELLKAAL